MSQAYSEAGLRFLVEDQQSHGAKWARDEIERLRAEIKALKEAAPSEGGFMWE